MLGTTRLGEPAMKHDAANSSPAASSKARVLVAARGANPSGHPHTSVKPPRGIHRGGGAFPIPKAGTIETHVDHTQTEETARFTIIVEADDEATLALVADVAKKMGARVTAANAEGK